MVDPTYGANLRCGLCLRPPPRLRPIPRRTRDRPGKRQLPAGPLTVAKVPRRRSCQRRARGTVHRYPVIGHGAGAWPNLAPHRVTVADSAFAAPDSGCPPAGGNRHSAEVTWPGRRCRVWRAARNPAQSIQNLHLRFEGITFTPHQGLRRNRSHALAALNDLLSAPCRSRCRYRGHIVSGDQPDAVPPAEIAGPERDPTRHHIFNDINGVRSGACDLKIAPPRSTRR